MQGIYYMNKKLLKKEVLYMDRRVTENLEGVSGLKKRKMGPFGIAFMLYCLVAAGAFGIEEMIPSSGPG